MDCKDFHPAKDGDGWVEQSSQHILFGLFQKVDLPRAYVCADSKIYEASEWYICQGMRCPANTHKLYWPQAKLPCEHERGRCKTRSKWFFREKRRKPEDAKLSFSNWLQNVAQAGMFDIVAESFPSATSSSSSSKKKKKKGDKQW